MIAAAALQAVPAAAGRVRARANGAPAARVAARLCTPFRTSARCRRASSSGNRAPLVTFATAGDVIGGEVRSEYDTYYPTPAPQRRAGVLLHPTSLPSPFGVGDIGPEAYAFVDWLKTAGFQIWQVLPLVPPDIEFFSPYSGTNAHTGNPMLISLELLVQDGLLDAADLPPQRPVGDCAFLEYKKAADPLLKKAARKLLATASGGTAVLQRELAQFREDPSVAPWLDEAALFDAIEKSQPAAVGEEDVCWWDWPVELRDRDAAALAKARAELKGDIDTFCAVQFLFDRQWRRLKAYANAAGVRLVGDMPIYVGGHSADVWANQGLWALGKKGAVSGVPPDAFSETGQLWGSPLYDWPAHEAEGYAWWASRMGRALALHDEVRIDHFRGLAGYWAVPADAETAVSGSWRVGPGVAFFDGLRKHLGDDLPIVAEDLGVITKDVVELREAIGAPGMAVLQFGWDGNPTNPHLPHMHNENSYCYTGTHDNETFAGWFKAAPENQRENFRNYCGSSGTDPAYEAARMALLSCARTAIIPMQDILRLDNSARFNTPGIAAGNWAWRMGPAGALSSLGSEAEQLRAMLYRYNRLTPAQNKAIGAAAEAALAAAKAPPMSASAPVSDSRSKKDVTDDDA